MDDQKNHRKKTCHLTMAHMGFHSNNNIMGLVVWNIWIVFPFSWEEYSQLTNAYFSEGLAAPVQFGTVN